MIHVLALTALDVEARGLARHLGLAAVGGGDFAHYHGGRLDVVSIGLAASRLDERLAEIARPALVVSAGVCGALAPHLATGELVAPETVITPDGTRATTDFVPGLARAGALLTVGEVVSTPAAKAKLWLETGALAVDMESASIVAWARARRLPVAVVRGISDTAREAVPSDLAELVEPGGRVRAARALRVALARPRVLVDAMALGRGTAAALKTVATALATIARS